MTRWVYLEHRSVVVRELTKLTTVSSPYDIPLWRSVACPGMSWEGVFRHSIESRVQPCKSEILQGCVVSGRRLTDGT